MPSTRTTLRPAARTSGSRAIFEFGGGTFAAGPRIDGNGSKRASACRIGPDGGSAAFSLWRISERWIGSRSSRAPGVWSATAPAIQTRKRPEAGHEHRAAHAVRHAELLAAAGRLRWKPSHLEHGGEYRAEHQRPEQGHERRVGRVRAVAQEQRPEPRAEERAQREADERQAARDQALAEAPDRHQDGEGDDDPVEAGQGAAGYPARVRVGGTTIERGSPESHVKSIPPARRRRITHRALPTLGGLAAVSLVAGLLVGAATESAAERTASSFAEAWKRGDYSAMHRLLTPDARARYPLAEFRRAYRRAAATATATLDRCRAIPDGVDGDAVTVPVVVDTRVFGALRGDVRDPGVGRAGRLVAAARVPRARPGRAAHAREPAAERARRSARATARCSREGPAPSRTSPLVGHRRLDRRADGAPGDAPRSGAALYARGFPEDWPVGQSGLEEVFEQRLRGRPGGELVAGGRVLARAEPRAARPVETTIDTRLQEAAVIGAGRPARRRGGARPAQRRGARPRRHRVLRARSRPGRRSRS